MYEAPKKALQSDRRFICSTVVRKKEKIIYFDLPAVICSCPDVNVSSYSAISEFTLQSFAKDDLSCSRRSKKAFILEGSNMN